MREIGVRPNVVIEISMLTGLLAVLKSVASILSPKANSQIIINTQDRCLN